MHIKKTKFFIRSATVLFAIPLSYYPVSTIAADHISQYMDPALTKMVVDKNACINASPKAILEVSPYTQEGQRLYKIEQVFDKAMQKALYVKTREDQIRDNRFVARKFCQGLASLSDMDLPITKNHKIQDANDGLLLARETRHRMVEVLDQIQQMNNLAVTAATGTNGSNDLLALDEKYQALMQQVDQIAENARFENLALLNGWYEQIDVPIHHGASYETVHLMNAATHSLGLNLIGTHLQSTSVALSAIGILASAINQSMHKIEGLKTTHHALEKAAKSDATITVIDLKTDQFTITKK